VAHQRRSGSPRLRIREWLGEGCAMSHIRSLA
jgi:hypothetical protein